MKHITLILLIILSGCSWSKSEIRWGIETCVATGADIYTTTQMLNNPDNYERNPIMGRHPSNTKVITYMVSSQILALTVAHFVPKWRKWILGSKTVVNFGAAIHNTRLDWDE